MSCRTAKGAPSSSGWQVHTAQAKTVWPAKSYLVCGVSIMRVEEGTTTCTSCGAPTRGVH
jgi:hypothetical protein